MTLQSLEAPPGRWRLFRVGLRSKQMKHAILPICTALIMLAAQIGPVSAQVTSQNAPGASDQWISHQMNQPLPGVGDKYSVSQDRIEEIRQLYLQAKKQLEDKADKKPADKK